MQAREIRLDAGKEPKRFDRLDSNLALPELVLLLEREEPGTGWRAQNGEPAQREQRGRCAQQDRRPAGPGEGGRAMTHGAPIGLADEHAPDAERQDGRRRPSRSTSREIGHVGVTCGP